MTQQFHEGQEVEVMRLFKPDITGGPVWVKAKIVSLYGIFGDEGWLVQFPGGTSAVVDETLIRAVSP